MALKYAKLQRIEGNREIRRDTDYDSWYHLEQALLLALRDSGTLNVMQYQLALEELRKQRMERARRLMQEDGK